jgi:hypothetical protein
MWTTPAIGAEVKAVLVVSALVLLALTGFILHTRGEWSALKHRLFKRLEIAEGISHPSRVAARISSPRWDAAFGETLERSVRDFRAEGNSVAVAILRAASDRDASFSELAREIALQAMTDGDLRSALVRLDQGLVYLLMFPGRHEDRRALRRYPSLERGWPAHAAGVRAAAGAGSAPMVALLYFLNLDAHDGTLLVVYEGDDNRRFPAEMAESAQFAPAGAGLTYDFALS